LGISPLLVLFHLRSKETLSVSLALQAEKEKKEEEKKLAEDEEKEARKLYPACSLQLLFSLASSL
jgi:hypothetical protein